MLSGLLAEVIRTQLTQCQRRLRRAGDVQRGLQRARQRDGLAGRSFRSLTGGFGNLVFPLQIGARDVAFPWLNMLSFWIFPVAGLMLFSSFLMGAPTAGWTEYPPISLQGRGRYVDVGRGDLLGRRQLDADRHQLRRDAF